MSRSDYESALDAFERLYVSKWEDALPIRDGDMLRIESAAHQRPAIGNQPKILHHGAKQKDVVVLIHGITDSPHYMEAIGWRLHQEGFNVVLPLLPAHGLKAPWPAMRALEHKDWVEEVDEVVRLAGGLGDRVSLGGFSTGGALAIRKVAKDPASVDGGIFLFSAALELGNLNEGVLESTAGPIVGRLMDSTSWAVSKAKGFFRRLTGRGTSPSESEEKRYGIGANPCKYSVFFNEGAAELAAVVDEIDDHYSKAGIERYSSISQPVFAVHSRTDASARFEGPELLIANHPDDRKQFFVIDDLPHSSVVLEEAISGAQANPEFKRMVDAMIGFAREQVTTG